MKAAICLLLLQVMLMSTLEVNARPQWNPFSIFNGFPWGIGSGVSSSSSYPFGTGTFTSTGPGFAAAGAGSGWPYGSTSTYGGGVASVGQNFAAAVAGR